MSISGLIVKLIELTNGWKSIIAYILLQIPFLTEHPLLVTAIEKVIQDPSPQNIGELIIQLLLLIGIGHKLFKPKA